MGPSDDNAAPGGGLQRTVTFGGDTTGAGQIRTLSTVPSRDPQTVRGDQEKPSDFSEDEKTEVRSEVQATSDKAKNNKAKNVDITEHMLSIEEVSSKYS
ncbi:hypothetical protein EV175_007725, partial [Coemansia sp. RSA 1933]